MSGHSTTVGDAMGSTLAAAAHDSSVGLEKKRAVQRRRRRMVAGARSPAVQLGLRLLTAAVATSATACDSGEPDPELALESFVLSSEPALEIGVIEGDPDYVFEDVVGVARLPSGNVVVSDRGSSALSMYDPAGAFVRRWGGRGGGPGEFETLSGVRLRADSILGMDTRGRGVSVFDTAGVFLRRADAVALAGDSVFSMDIWLHGRYWVIGGLEPEARDAVRTVLDRFPTPPLPPGTGDPGGVGYRTVWVDGSGHLWIPEPFSVPDAVPDAVRDADGGTVAWTRLSPEGIPVSVVRIPRRFEPLWMSPSPGEDLEGSELFGRWRGEADVHFVRAHTIVAAEPSTSSPPDWIVAGVGGDGDPFAEPSVGPAAARPAETASETQTVPEGMGDAMRRIATLQEIHYARAGAYTASIDSLAWDPPEGILVDFVNADDRGWAAVLLGPSSDRLCGLGYGRGTPRGWPSGRIVCGPSSPAR